MNYEKVSFENTAGETLGARLDLPLTGEPIAYALFAHCFTCTKNLKAVDNISLALTRERIAVLRFDFTGLGESEGDFAETNFSSNVDDLVKAAEFLAEKYQAPKILLGHSLGGAAVIQAAPRLESVAAVATIGAPCDPAHVTHLLENSREEIEETGQAKVTLAGRSFTIKKQFLDDLQNTNMENILGQLRKALLVMHAPLDNIVGIDNAAHIFEAAKHPKSFISLDEADHLLSDERDSRYVGVIVEAWARKFLDVPLVEDNPTPKALDKQVVTRIDRQKYRTEILASGHSLVADEPTSVGGRNLGPNPYDFLLSSLGTCTAMTLRMYADRKDWPLESVVVRLSHSKVHAEDCENCESKTGKVDFITREIEVIGPLDETQRDRLLEIANKCPVHRTLHNEITVESSLKA